MKRCIKGEQVEDEGGWREEDKITPKFLNLQKVPGVGDKDSVGSKIEALRAYLEKEIGDEFYTIYKLIQEEKDDDYETVKQLLGERTKFIPLIVQLIVC